MSLEDIQVTSLSRINVVGGDVFHGMKQTDVGYAGFGEAYFSWVVQGAIKAWKRHNRMTMNLVVPAGSVRFVFFAEDERKRSLREEVIGEERYARLTVPPGTWFGLQGLAAPKSLVLNIASIIHDPLEVERRDMSDINYNWR